MQGYHRSAPRVIENEMGDNGETAANYNTNMVVKQCSKRSNSNGSRLQHGSRESSLTSRFQKHLNDSESMKPTISKKPSARIMRPNISYPVEQFPEKELEFLNTKNKTHATIDPVAVLVTPSYQLQENESSTKGIKKSKMEALHEDGVFGPRKARFCRKNISMPIMEQATKLQVNTSLPSLHRSSIDGGSRRRSGRGYSGGGTGGSPSSARIPIDQI